MKKFGISNSEAIDNFSHNYEEMIETLNAINPKYNSFPEESGFYKPGIGNLGGGNPITKIAAVLTEPYAEMTHII